MLLCKISHSRLSFLFWHEFVILGWICHTGLNAKLSFEAELSFWAEYGILSKNWMNLFSYNNDKKSLIQRIKKCLVLSSEKEPKCSIQENLRTTRSFNHRKKIVVCSDTKPQNKFLFCGLERIGFYTNFYQKKHSSTGFLSKVTQKTAKRSRYFWKKKWTISDF